MSESKGDDEKKTPWLHAHHDPVASIRAYTECVRLCDLEGRGDAKLLVANADKRLKGTACVQEIPLMCEPSSMAIFYTQNHDGTTIPNVAVAAGSEVTIYRNLRPYYLFKVPPISMVQKERAVWDAIRGGEVAPSSGIEQLRNLQENQVLLTPCSVDLLALKDPSAQAQFAQKISACPLQQQTVITCMEAIPRDIDEPRACSMLIVGTEHRQVLILEHDGTKAVNSVTLPDVPAFIAATGTYTVEYRIVVATRSCKIFTIKKGKATGRVIQLETPAVGLCILEKSIYVACMDNCVHCYAFKGKKLYSLYFPDPITNLAPMSMKHIRRISVLLVATRDGQVRMYNKKQMVVAIQSPGEVLTAVRFGPYGREDASLVLCYRSGALTIKMLKRAAKLDVPNKAPGPPKEQDIPLDVPKKTKLYVEQIQRERDQATDMHLKFQRDLCKLRLTTARTYVKVITQGQGPISHSGAVPLHLDARVMGLGPLFKLHLTLKNIGQRAVCDVPIKLVVDSSIYSIESSLLKVPCVLPGLDHVCEVNMRCIDPEGGAAPVRVFVCSSKSTVPAISAIINMPMSELKTDD